MRCSRCQHDNRSGRRFCAQCGGPLAVACASCGFANESGDQFCGGCGAALAAPAPSATPARLGAPNAYTPQYLAEKILTSRSVLEGERKQVTVLFADLKGSMELLADRDPEAARQLLDPVLERMMEAVHHYEGTVNQVMGDGIMALFGAPVAHEDHAVRACYAALRMQRRVGLYTDEIQQRGGTPVQIRVGLNSGEVVVRAIGSDLHMDYTAVGQTTHLAARMEQLAKPGSALVTGETLKLAEGFVQVRPLGAVPVKGLDAPTPVYELTGTVATRSRLQVSAARGLTRFVGRDPELAQLGQALDRAAAGHGQAVAVVGEAGVGKSRLAWEFTRSHRTQGWLVLESGSVSYGRATPYLPVLELLKAYCRIQERDEPRVIRERVAGKLLMLDRALEPLLTPLLALLDVPVEDAAWAALGPPQRRQRTLDAVKGLLLRESQVQPLLLLFEDLHWIDAETQALLDALMESLPTARVLLLVNYRPEYQHAWGQKSYYLQLRLDPLPPEGAEALLDALVGTDEALAPLRRLLIARTEGNPFFLEESVQALVETGVLAGERGAYRLTKATELVQIPATAQAMLAARIDRLSPEDKRLLQTASVIGKDVPFALLRAIADTSEDSLRQGLAHLQRAEFLYETSLFPDLEYTFKHALTHEVTYGSVLQERRRALHVRIVAAIEQLYPDRLAEHIERLADHAFKGEAWAAAVAYLRQAGARAFDRSAYRESATYFEQALVALGHLPQTREVVEQGIDTRFTLRTSLLPLGDVTRMEKRLREAQALAETLDDQRRSVRVLHYLMIQRVLTGQHEEGLKLGGQALAIATNLRDVALEVPTNAYLGLMHLVTGTYREAARYLARNVGLISADLRQERFGQALVQSAFSRQILAEALAELGEFGEAISHANDAVHIAETAHHDYTLAFACLSRGLVAVRQGDWPTAIHALERGRELCRDGQITILIPLIGGTLGCAYGWAGRVDDGVRLLEQAVDEATARRLLYRYSLNVVFLGEACLLADRVGEAITHGQEALALGRRQHERGQVAHALRLLGEIASQREPADVETAEPHFREALTLATELGMRPLVAHCHLGLGRLNRRTGDAARAEEHLATATRMYREMGMTFWLRQTEDAV